MNYFNQGSQYFPNVPQQPAYRNYNGDQNTSYNPNLTQYTSRNPSANTYNPQTQCNMGNPPPIGFNVPNLYPTNLPYGPYGGTANNSPNFNNNSFNSAPPLYYNGICGPSPNNIAANTYGTPPQFDVDANSRPPYNNYDYNNIPLNNNSYSAFGSLPNDMASVDRYTATPTAPLDNTMLSENLNSTTRPAEMNSFHRIDHNRISNLPKKTQPDVQMHQGSKNAVGNSGKSTEYQKGLDKLASLMDQDVDLTEKVLRQNREKYDLNKY